MTASTESGFYFVGFLSIWFFFGISTDSLSYGKEASIDLLDSYVVDRQVNFKPTFDLLDESIVH